MAKTKVILGGWSESEEANEEIQKICDQVKHNVEKRTGRNYKEFKAVLYRSQVVSGMNYLIKVLVDGGVHGYLHIELYEPFQCGELTIELRGVEENRTKEDPLLTFPPF